MLSESEWGTLIDATKQALATRGELPYFELPLPTELDQLSARCPPEVQTRFHVAWQQLPATLQANRIEPALLQGVPTQRLAVLCRHLVNACHLNYTEQLEDIIGVEARPERSSLQFAARLWGVSEADVTPYEFESKQLRRYFQAPLPLSAVCQAIRRGVPILVPLGQDREVRQMAQEVASMADEQLLSGPWIQLCVMLRDRFLQMLDPDERWDLWTRYVIPAASVYNKGERLVFHPDLIDLCGPP